MPSLANWAPGRQQARFCEAAKPASLPAAGSRNSSRAEAEAEQKTLFKFKAGLQSNAVGKTLQNMRAIKLALGRPDQGIDWLAGLMATGWPPDIPEVRLNGHETDAQAQF